MSYSVNSGNPFLRYNDPMPPKVDPRGLQSQSVYTAPLGYFTEGGELSILLNEPPSDWICQVLFFGSDYPISVLGVQDYAGDTFQPTSTALLPLQNPITELAFPLANFNPAASAIESVSEILATLETVGYQQKLSGPTTTNAIEVTGFPYYQVIQSHNLYATNAGSAGDFASYIVTLTALLSGAIITGPGAFYDFLPAEAVAIRFPIILWEPNLTQQIVDDGFVIIYTPDPAVTITLDVVGLWASEDYSPVPAVIPPAARRAAPADGDAPAAPAGPSAAEVSALLRKYLLKGKV